jgi:nucleoid DNA-binding protein
VGMKREQLKTKAIPHGDVMNALCNNLGKRFPRMFVQEVVAQYLDLVTFALATGRPIRMKHLGTVQTRITRPTFDQRRRPTGFNLTMDMTMSKVGAMKVRRVLKQINYVVLPKNRSTKIETIPKRWLL